MSQPSHMTPVLSTFLRSYINSNRCFPQTRCYFVVDIASKLGAAALTTFLSDLPMTSEKVIKAFAAIANSNHREHGVDKAVDVRMINADIGKMLMSLEDSFARYCDLKGTANCHEAFSQACTRLKHAIDASNVSAEYLEFVSPRTLDRTGGVALVRVRNTFLENRLFEMQVDHANILTAIEPEVVRSILVLRSSS